MKSYLDHVVRKGRTLGLASEGLAHDKRCPVLMAAGGVYTERSPIHDVPTVVQRSCERC